MTGQDVRELTRIYVLALERIIDMQAYDDVSDPTHWKLHSDSTRFGVE